MAEKPTLYQPLPRRPFGLIAVSELAGAICCQVATSEPGNSACPRGEWYCQNPECVVREVTVYCKLYGEPLPRMRCPACRQPLKFHHWLESRTLVPYREDTASA